MSSDEGKDLNHQDKNTAMDIVHTLTAIGTKLVCIDFDATFLSIHTGGSWENSARDLYRYVRPLFRSLIPLVTQAHMHVAVVTFSPQVDLIRQVLAHCFEKSIAERIIIRGDDTSWRVSNHDCAVFRLDSSHVEPCFLKRTYKLPYIISAATHVTKACQVSICNQDTVLIDDDHHTIRHVNDHGIAGIWFEPQETDIRSLCDSVKRLHVSHGTPLKIRHHPNTPLQTKSSYPETQSSESESESESESSDQIKTPAKLKDDDDMREMMRMDMDTGATTAVNQRTFSLCTPSPVMKMRHGQPFNPRKPTKMRCSRNIQHTIDHMEMSITRPSP